MERNVINKLKKKKPGLLINFILEMKKTFALDKLRTELYSFEKKSFDRKDYRDYPENYIFLLIVLRTSASIES